MPCKGRVGCGKIAQWPGLSKYGHNLIDPETIVMRRVNLIDPETIVMRWVNFLSCIFFFRVFLVNHGQGPHKPSLRAFIMTLVHKQHLVLLGPLLP